MTAYDNSQDSSNYMTAKGNYPGIFGWIFSLDHKRIGILYLAALMVFFAGGAILGVLMRLELIAPGRQIMGAQTYDAIFTVHGITMIFSVSNSFDSVIARQFPDPAANWGARSVFSPLEPALVVALYHRLRNYLLRAIWDRQTARYGLDFLYAIQHNNRHNGDMGHPGNIHHWFFHDSDWHQFYYNDSPHESARDDLVSNAAVCVGNLCDLMDTGAGHADHRHYICAAHAGQAYRVGAI